MESLSNLVWLLIGSYRDSPGNAIKCTFDGQLKDIFQGYKPKQQRKMYYQQVACCVSDLLPFYASPVSQLVLAGRSFVCHLIFFFVC